jgi:hypothetical protein
MSHIFVIEMIDFAPKACVPYATFRYETVYMGIPFQRASKCVKNQDVTRCEVLTLVDLIEHPADNTAGSFKKTVEKVSVFKKIVT